MNRLTRLLFVSLLVVFIAAGAAAPAFAAAPPKGDFAEPTKMKVEVNINTDWLFWEYPYLSRQNFYGVPAMVKIGWASGADGAVIKKYEPLILPKNKEGKLEIVTEKNDLVTVEVQVVDNKDRLLGKFGFTVRNHKQTEKIQIAPPLYTEPEIVWGG